MLSQGPDAHVHPLQHVSAAYVARASWPSIVSQPLPDWLDSLLQRCGRVFLNLQSCARRRARPPALAVVLHVSAHLHLAHLHLLGTQQLLLLLLQARPQPAQAAVFVDVGALGERVLA